MPRKSKDSEVRGREAGAPMPPPAQAGVPPLAEEAERPTAAAPAPERAPPARRVQNIGDTERLVSLAGGTLLALVGLARRSWTGMALAGAGALLAYRGASGHSYVYQRIGVERPGGPVEMTQSVTVNRAPEEVYGFWRKLENLPRFMRHLRSVEQTSETRSHWVAQALATGKVLEWDAEIVEDRPNELIGWRSVPNGAVQHSGEVRFKPAPGGRGTEVHVRMEYRPPAGTAVAAVMYPFSRQMLKQEIRRLKHVLETGEIPTTEGQPSGAPRPALR